MATQTDTAKAWRPAGHIRIKVIGLARHRGRLLVCEVLDDSGAITGWCPPGGGVEFGESAAEALEREIREELGCGITIFGPAVIQENIYEHHGVKGHEIIFAFSIQLADPDLYTRDRFQIQEDSGNLHWVEWIDMARFRAGALRLFPSAMADLILSE